VAVKHVVLMKFKKDASPERIKEIFAALGNLRGQFQGLMDFAGGTYASGEGLNRGYTHGFVMTFRDAACRDMYLPDPAHKRVVNMLLPELEGGVNGVLAFDWDYNPAQ
jgi:hypothetical protein